MAAVTIDPKLDPEGWKLDRRRRITATDAAAIVGKHPYRSRLDVYLDKLGLAPEVEVSEAMRWGLILESPILAEYARRTGRGIDREQVYTSHPTRDWQAATLDAVADDGRVVEVKTIGLRNPLLGELGPEGTDEVPVAWLIQVQHQLAVSGREVADVAALVGGQELRIYTVPRHEDVIGKLTDREERFRAEHLERKVPPEPDRADDADRYGLLYPEREGGVVWSAPTTLALLDEFERLGVETRQLEKRRKEVKAELLHLLADHQRATTTDGRTVEAKQRNRSGYTVDPCEFLDFRVKTTPGQIRGG